MKLSQIKGIGEKTEALFNKLNIYDTLDLLFYFPINYEVFEKIVPINEIEDEGIYALYGSIITKVEIIKRGKYQILSTTLKDSNNNVIKLSWFNMIYLKNLLNLGTRLVVRGRVSKKFGTFTLEQGSIYKFEDYASKINQMQPIYSKTKSLSNKTIIKAVQTALNTEFLSDYVPYYIREKENLLPLNEALRMIHFPEDKNELLEARKRLSFNELFLFIISMKILKDTIQNKENKFDFKDFSLSESILNNLPFKLTKAQDRVWNEIKDNLTKRSVMNRLIQGDVGSGKTIIAFLAMLSSAYNNYQSALMVPTEVLARQHYKALRQLMNENNLHYKVVLLIGAMSAKEKKEAKEIIKNESNVLIIGTHALIQEDVIYNNLSLVITDEQHRFGLRQRELLASKGENPNLIIMSATPIPRSLALIIYGDLDISIIDELPAERLPIKNCVVDTSYRENAYKFIEKEVLNNRQCYIICPLVEESETLDVEDVVSYSNDLKQRLGPSISIDYIHGKMTSEKKEEIMDEFINNKIQVLVSTTVIEVGINNKNATVMMIENAERFGLSTLHQLRGRVGRGEHQSYCIFISGTKNKDTMEKLSVLAQSNDGFYIAKKDLATRGPGDFFGLRQSGELDFKISDIMTDSEMIYRIQNIACELLDNKNLINDEEWKLIYDKIKNKVKVY